LDFKKYVFFRGKAKVKIFGHRSLTSVIYFKEGIRVAATGLELDSHNMFISSFIITD